MSTKRLLCFHTVVLILLTRPAIAQLPLGGRLVPSVGVGVFPQIGPHLQFGLQLQRPFRDTFAATIQVAGWSAVATCFEESDGRSCPSRGTSADVGIDARRNRGGTVHPYVGVGAGAISIRGWSPAVNTRVGVAIGSARGVQLHLEFRVQRNWQTVYISRSMLTVGVGW